jgi:hypothetical protein
MEISESEAHVRVQMEPTTVPKSVILIHLRTRMAYEATVAWSGDDGLGLRFSCAHDLRNPSTPELEAMSAHCAGH